MKIKAKVLGIRNDTVKLEYDGKIYFGRNYRWPQIGDFIEVYLDFIEEAGGYYEEVYIGGGRDEYNQSLFHNLNDP